MDCFQVLFNTGTIPASQRSAFVRRSYECAGCKGLLRHGAEAREIYDVFLACVIRWGRGDDGGGNGDGGVDFSREERLGVAHCNQAGCRSLPSRWPVKQKIVLVPLVALVTKGFILAVMCVHMYERELIQSCCRARYWLPGAFFLHRVVSMSNAFGSVWAN